MNLGVLHPIQPAAGHDTESIHDPFAVIRGLDSVSCPAVSWDPVFSDESGALR
jgi:hypothetical protein